MGNIKRSRLKIILFAIGKILRLKAGKHEAFLEFMRRRNCVVQIRLKDGTIGRHYRFTNGKVESFAGIHDHPDVPMSFTDLATALTFMNPKPDQAAISLAAKTFRVVVEGRDELAVWFLQLMNMINTAGLEFGTVMRDGTQRYTTISNGGPLFVFVKDGRIVRTTPIDLEPGDAPSWTIRARGRSFTPQRRATQ